MKHYTNEIMCSYIFHTFFNVEINKPIKISLRSLQKHIKTADKYVSDLIKEGYVKVFYKGGFCKGSTIYQIVKKYPVFDFSELKQEINEKLKRNKEAIIKNDNLFLDISDEDFIKLSKEQQKFVNNINTKNITFRQSTNGSVWTEFCSIEKELRKSVKQIDTNESLCEIDINASIPRLIPTFFKNRIKDWLDIYKQDIADELEIYENVIKKYNDAYTGLIEYLELEMSRDIFKDFFLKMVFGAGAKEQHNHDIKDAFSVKFPAISQQLNKFSTTYRIKKQTATKSWKKTQFAGMIFEIQAKIINGALKQLDCPKYSVYDSINVPEEYSAYAYAALRASFLKITGDSSMFVCKVNGHFSRVEDKSVTLKRGEGGGTILDPQLSFNPTKTTLLNQDNPTKKERLILKRTVENIRVRVINNNGSKTWIYEGLDKPIKKSCKKIPTEQEFREYVISEINKKENIEPIGTQSNVVQTSEIVELLGETFLDTIFAEDEE